MQVATLFRESATLLGATMEAGGVGAGGHDAQASITSPGMSIGIDTFTHPTTNKFKLNMKLEPQDDGYETSADLMLSSTTNHNDSIKCESLEDPYSFIDEDPMTTLPTAQSLTHCAPSMTLPQVTLPAPKKRGRKKKIKNEPGTEYDLGLNGNVVPKAKERKKHDRFNGMPEEEVSKRTLPDHLATNLDIIIIGINPGLFAAYKGHHYAGPGNHFWKCLYLSGLTPEQMTADEDYKLLQVGIGFTNMVQRPTKGSADLTRKEIKEGCQILLEKLQRFKPKIAVFNGKLIYEVFSGKKDFSFGRQPDLVDGTNTYMWVMPSSSARCAQLPRAADKVPFYAALKKFRDYLNGIVTSIDDSEVVFSDSRLKSCCEMEPKSEALYSMDLMDISNAVVKRDEVIPCKKKRGRPKKIKVEGEETKPVVRRVVQSQNLGNCDFPKKKRGRPKKIKCETSDVHLHERNAQTPITKCFSSPSPIQSPTSFCHMNSQMTPPSNASNSMYNNSSVGTVVSLALGQQQTYSQSPRPHSQPFTHSDLSSEISAAISSDHLGSPAPTSPSLGPPDFDPPTSMPTDDTTECRFSSPTPSTASEQPATAPLGSSTPYSNYHTFGIDSDGHSFAQAVVNHGMQTSSNNVSEYKVQDVSSKSLSGLESLVDQIPSIADGESVTHGNAAGVGNNGGSSVAPENGEHYAGAVYGSYGGVANINSRSLNNSSPTNTNPATQTSYNYPLSNGSYSGLPVPPLSGSPGAFAVNNLTNSYGHNSPPTSSAAYHHHHHHHHHNIMSGSHSFIEHHGCAMPQMPVPLPAYSQLPYTQQFSNSYPPPPHPPPPSALHVPSPNYPPPYYSASYPHTQPPGTHSPAPAYHMFDRIKPDIGYGSF